MPIALSAIVFLALLYGAFMVPRFRWAFAVAAVLMGLGVVGYMVVNDRARPAQEARIAVEEVELSDLSFTPGPRFLTVQGRAVNGSSDWDLLDFTLQVTVFDCPDLEAAPQGCDTIGQSQGIARVSIPPGQLRSFSVPLSFPNLPDVIGEPFWEEEIVSVRAGR
ncbi:hypothetical protein [Oceanomicrobium pacificus]|uniref:DUF3426 domain-containing protein n=1 Tax=Oceanomicrobium pacificus TaxID=2692916 RepID=A0A6B0U3Q9_9RHOB|nr:hypothetical protein [Oceanomicrobium pacificus]MXU65581.1 hypothetical protein [Oceanomicrobium pacificus]